MANSKLDQLVDALLELKKGNKQFFLKSICDYYPRCFSVKSKLSFQKLFSFFLFHPFDGVAKCCAGKLSIVSC